ncbi:major histocompatibility complex class I-related gene protein-like [Mugil cephalus]|uniref:major histocompatibility complex class I-related gene protein-like n=1 Tax=Mugil cephalus TaxID=48193 RepID=UPI001FB6D25A|nr:major histocompatibility complex class I-related gene protein-like [Mugil cephalus]
MECLFLLLLFCHGASSVTHRLSVYFTGSLGDRNLPELVGVAMVDEVGVLYCDSNIQRAEPRQNWMTKLMEDDPTQIDWYNNECRESHSFFNNITKDVTLNFNQTEGVHTMQRMFGCEWDDETSVIGGFDQFGYDGEDFITFNLNSKTWIAVRAEAAITKHKWESNRDGLSHTVDHLTQLCPERLRRFLNYGRSFLMRKEVPSVSLLQKTPSSPVSCHATGFYPDRVMMFWRKDGEEIHEGVQCGRTLPNHDGSFQMNVDLNISSVLPKDWKRYDCVFHLCGVKDIIIELDKAQIRTNRKLSSSCSVHSFTHSGFPVLW